MGEARRETDRSADVELVAVLQALSDPVRLEIVRQLAGCSSDSAISCGQIELDVSKSTASHHLKTLRTAGIVAEREEGTRKLTWLTPSCGRRAGSGDREGAPGAPSRDGWGYQTPAVPFDEQAVVGAQVRLTVEVPAAAPRFLA